MGDILFYTTTPLKELNESIAYILVHQPTVTSNQITTTMSEFALYIPCVYKNITEEMIAQTFYRKKIGSVRHVDIVPHNDKYNRAHVFFESMYPFGQGAEQISQVANGETVKLQYSRNQHVFWLLMKNRREYDGVSKKGWYDVEAENAKKEAAAGARVGGGICEGSQPMFVGSQYDTDDLSVMHPQVEKETNEMDNDMDNEDPESFGLVSVDYVQSLETELARMRMQCGEAERVLPPITPLEEYLFQIRSDNYHLRWKYYDMCRAKLPVEGNTTPPVIEQVSEYDGCSTEFEHVVRNEIERLRKDNETLNQNVNVLSCIPTTSSYVPEHMNAMTEPMDQLHLPPSPINVPVPPGINVARGFAAEPHHDIEAGIPQCDCPIQG
jgi:hypothetical protein